MRKSANMSSDERLLLDYMSMLRHLSTDLKLRLIAHLSESIRLEQERTEPVEEETWKKLYGAWMDTPDDLATKLREDRLPGREIPSFDA
jgi:hypothetical protein